MPRDGRKYELVDGRISPEDRPRAVLDKVGEYLEAGVSLVWVIDPEARSAAPCLSGQIGSADQ